MKKILLLLFVMIQCHWLHAQQEILVEDAAKHVGDSVKICTKIYGGVYLERSKGTPTLLNAGGAFPNAPLTLVIWPATRATYKTAPEELYKDKEVCITGRIILYKDKPEIIITDEKQLTFKD